MNIKFLLPILCLLPSVAGAAIPYRVEQLKMPAPAEDFSDINRFYIGGAYNFAMWQNYTDEDNISVNGENTSCFEFMAGYRIYDTFRMELNYLRTDAQYNAFSFSGHTFFVNAIWDARIDSMYRLFRSQMLVPYVGVGGGLSWNSADDGVHLDNKIAPVAAAMAGVSVEFNKIFALDFGYRYFYMFNPGADIMSNFNPSAHQFRAGARISF